MSKPIWELSLADIYTYVPWSMKTAVEQKITGTTPKDLNESKWALFWKTLTSASMTE